jgi:hypothetical protein
VSFIIHQVVIKTLLAFNGVVLVEFIHNLQVVAIVNLESSDLDFLLPHVVVHLDVVQDRIHESFDVGVLVTQQLQHNRDHLSLVQDDVSRWFEEQEFKESVQDLLHHLIVFLLSSQQVLQHFNEI